MLTPYLIVLSLTLLVLLGVLPAVVGELSYTLLLALTTGALYRLARRSRGLRWQRGLLAMVAVALTTTLANLAWVYGSVTGHLPPALELVGAALYMVQAVPWTVALSLALFIVYDRLRGSVYLEVLVYTASLSAGVVFVSALLLGLVLDVEQGIALADRAAIFFSTLLLIPALALARAPGGAPFTRAFRLISSATAAWALAAGLYVFLPAAHADMVYNAFALAQWFLFYSAARAYAAGTQPLAEGSPEGAEVV